MAIIWTTDIRTGSKIRIPEATINNAGDIADRNKGGWVISTPPLWETLSNLWENDLKTQRIILVVGFIVILWLLFWTIRFGIQSTGIFDIDENAEVQSVGICRSSNDSIEPEKLPSTIYNGYHDDILICGELISQFPAELIFVWFKDDKVIRQDSEKIAPGYFYHQWPSARYLEPGQYRVEIWYWHQKRSEIKFSVSPIP